MSGRYECIIHGAVVNLPQLLERLVGITNSLSFDGTENLFEHEIVYKPNGILSLVFIVLNSDVFTNGAFVKLKYRNWYVLP
jgi:hypothetical protein